MNEAAFRRSERLLLIRIELLSTTSSKGLQNHSTRFMIPYQQDNTFHHNRPLLRRNSFSTRTFIGTTQ